ncbi:hypothetical protein B0A52_07833 [Exophiala mesophila]|uniref:Amidohydrolase-related domain-containing protein n=1 Tax=Exophiala mesophila TaxID=212818 RepID=A0A438MXP4_EXOME|nr:hypothetical protein B0A52_07833 [Exophiala mesophila]
MGEAITTDEQATLIKADLLIPGRGEPLHDAALVADNEKILYVGPQTNIPSEYTTLEATHVPVLMPGMWDCHAHFLGMNSFSIHESAFADPVLVGARISRDATEYLNAGFTSVRETGGYGIHLDMAVQEGIVIGPKIYSCGDILSQTGGHGDVHDMPLHAYTGICSRGYMSTLCDGVDECLKAVRTQIRKGACFVKICASGGLGTLRDNPSHQQFSDVEIQTFVDEAKRNGRIVAAHCHGKPGILAALNAGVRTIEHGTELDDECIELMLKKGAILVPTRSLHHVSLELGKWTSGPAFKKLQRAVPIHAQAYSKAIKAGVKIALGSDLFLSSPGHMASHGSAGLEVMFAVEAGMTPLEAIEAATANCPDTLGDQAPANGTGQLKEGFAPDFIAVAKDPLQDINVLTDATNITHVWRGGKLYKSPSTPIIPVALQKK